MGVEGAAWQDKVGTIEGIAGASMRPGEGGRSYGDGTPCRQEGIACWEELQCKEHLAVDEE